MMLKMFNILNLNLADGVINAAGMGFNGYDESGDALWNKFTNANVKNIEVRSSRFCGGLVNIISFTQLFTRVVNFTGIKQ